VKLFTKPNSKFYWYDFAVRGFRYRGSTLETKSVRALQAASLKLASAIESTDPLPGKPPVLGDLSERFLDWVNNSRLEEKTKKFYRNGWRLLKVTSVAVVRVNQITGDCAEQLTFPASAANANCALRTLRRMLHLLSVHSRYVLHARGVAMRPSPSKGPTASLPPLPLRLLPGGANQFPGGSCTR
jgi:hypothetical protein